MTHVFQRIDAHVHKGLDKIREKPWAEPLGKALSTGATIISGMDGLVPGLGLLGGAMALGASLLNPNKEPTVAGLQEELRSDFGEIKLEMKNILKNIVEHNLTISDEILTMKDMVSQTYLLVADVKYQDGIEQIDAAYHVFLSESSCVQFEDFQTFAFQLQTLATKNFDPNRIKEYLRIIHKEGGGLEMCQIVLDYFTVVLSKYLQMMVSYSIFREDSRKVASHFEQFNTLYGSFAAIFKEVTGKSYKAGCKDELEKVGKERKLQTGPNLNARGEANSSLGYPEQVYYGGQKIWDRVMDLVVARKALVEGNFENPQMNPTQAGVLFPSDESIEPLTQINQAMKSLLSKKEMPKFQIKEDLYVLILGETGVGKSTWVNGIANYLQHETLDDAMNGEFKVLIPSSFVHVDEDGSQKNITIGNASKDEISETGKSATQVPKEYVFETASSIVHLIDTPGICDVRGLWKDKENFDNIMSFLLKYQKINAVCVLLKPNSSRLTVPFRFCVLELFTHLHKSLEQNLLFCFTNSRSTFYRPGETLPVLQNLLKDNNVGLKLDKTRYFCFDNEAFRFLACLKKGVHFDDDEKQMFAQSWQRSMQTSLELFQRVKDLPPHKTKETLSMNEARSIIIALTKPMAEIMQIIDRNKKKIEDVKRQIDSDQDDISNRSIEFRGFVLERQHLDYPITVCANSDCKESVPVGETKVTNHVYPVICHRNCTIKGLPTETINDERLATCYAFEFFTEMAFTKFFGKPLNQLPGYGGLSQGSIDGRDVPAGETSFQSIDLKALEGSLTPEKREMFKQYKEAKFNENCWNCNHSYKEHLQMTYTTRIVEKAFLPEKVQQEIKNKKGSKLQKNAFLSELTKTRGELEIERAFIMTSATRFGSFLSHNALVRYNDAFKDYIEMLLRDEQSKSVRDDEQIQKLEEDKRNYEEERKVLDDPVKSAKECSITTEDIFDMRDKLIQLKHNGKAIQDALDGILSARQQPASPRVVE